MPYCGRALRNPFIRKRDTEQQRSYTPPSFTFGGIEYLMQNPLASTGPIEYPQAYGDIALMFRSNPVVFALCDVRAKAIGEARFQWRDRVDGRPGKYFGSPELARLEQPWPGATTRTLVTRMVQDVDLAGNAYVMRIGDGVARLRPDWVMVVIESPSGDPNDARARVKGYQYHPYGFGNSPDGATVDILPEDMCHWMPTPDPAFRHRGISWITTALAEVVADSDITGYKSRFFQNGATVSTVLTTPEGVKGEQFETAKKKFLAEHAGEENAHKVLFLSYGSDVKTIGSDPESAQMKILQGASETRIAAAAGVPPVIAGFSEGLSSTSYAAYAASRRRFADYTLHPLLGSLAEALQNLVDLPDGADPFLTYDPRDISHFQEDTKDASTIQQQNAATISTLFQAGFDPTTIVEAVTTGELVRLKHLGGTSAQVTPDVPEDPEPDPAAGPVAPIGESQNPPDPANPEEGKP